MLQGTTPTHTFQVPIRSAIIKEARVIYSQNGKEILCKRTSDCSISEVDDNSALVSFTLSQEDTFKFDPRYDVELQVRIFTIYGQAYASYPQSISCIRCLSSEVIK